jgi:hypothetical protein
MDINITLSRPLGERTEINFPFSEVRGRDIVAAQTEFETLTGMPTVGVLELNKNFQAYLASKISKIPYEEILDLPIADFHPVTMAVQRFLFGAE